MAKSAKDNNVLIKKNYYFILNILIAIIPKIYDLFLPVVGVKWKLQVLEGEKLIPTDLGVFVEWLLNIIVIISIIWYNIASAKKGTTIKKSEVDKLINDNAGLRGTNQLLYKILHSTYKTCSSKYDTLLSQIKEWDSKPNHRSVKIVSDPCKQLKSIIEQMVNCVAKITDIEESVLRTRVAFRLKGKEWQWLTGYSSSGYFNIENLSNSTNSTFNRITKTDSSRESFIFFNRKSLAVKAGKYVYEPYRDFEGDTILEDTTIIDGSILAKSLYVGENHLNIFAEMVIFIDTSDDCLFTSSESKEDVKKIKGLLKQEILSNFEQRLKIELSLLYIHSCL